MAYNSRGYAFEELAQYKQAIVGFDKAIQLDPDYAVAHTSTVVLLTASWANTSRSPRTSTKPVPWIANAANGFFLRRFSYPKRPLKLLKCQ